MYLSFFYFSCGRVVIFSKIHFAYFAYFVLFFDQLILDRLERFHHIQWSDLTNEQDKASFAFKCVGGVVGRRRLMKVPVIRGQDDKRRVRSFIVCSV